MVRTERWLCAILVGAACGEGAPIGGDVIDAAVDAPDAGACVVTLPECSAMPTVDRARCEAAPRLEAGAPRPGQDSAAGGYGDCAASGSGLGGPSLYYRVEVPAGSVARVAAVPTAAGQDGLVRAFATCAATEALQSGRGGGITQGAAAVCLRNQSLVTATYMIAVSRYSGEARCLPLTFDVSIDVRPLEAGGQEIE